MAWALEQQHVRDAPSRHVLLCLANYANEKGRGAYPSVRTLAEDTGLSERTIQIKLSGLKQSGMIRRGDQARAARISRSDRRPVVYDLAMDRDANAATGCDANDLRPVNITGCTSEQNGVQITTERGARVSPNPSSIHQVTEKHTGADAPPAGRGARLPPDWAPSPELDVWALSRPGITADVLANETAKFIDYWRAVPGSKGVKLDWSATFRNWIRNVKGVSNGGKKCSGSLVDRAAGRAREIFAGT